MILSLVKQVTCGNMIYNKSRAKNNIHGSSCSLLYKRSFACDPKTFNRRDCEMRIKVSSTAHTGTILFVCVMLACALLFNGTALSAEAAGAGATLEEIVEKIVDDHIAGLNYKKENYTGGEMALIINTLIEKAETISPDYLNEDAPQSRLYLSDIGFNMALGDLLATYSTPGDTIADTESVEEVVNSFMTSFGDRDIPGMLAHLTEECMVMVGPSTYGRNELPGVLEDLYERYEKIDFEISFYRVVVDGDTAEVYTREFFFMKGGESQDDHTDSWNMLNRLEKVSGEWKLAMRNAIGCSPAKKDIITDGYIGDWVGATPCIVKKLSMDENEKEWSMIDAVYFARDKHNLHWRIDISPDFAVEIDAGDDEDVPGNRLPRGVYMLTFLRDLDDPDCSQYNSIATHEFLFTTLMGRTCVRQEDDRQKEVYRDLEQVGAKGMTIEGTIPINDFRFQLDGVKVNGSVIKKKKDGELEDHIYQSDSADLVMQD